MHLDTLKRNLDKVPLEVLETTYQKPFRALQQDIKRSVNAYVRWIAFHGILVKETYLPEVKRLLAPIIHKSELTKQISWAAFREPDIGEIERLARLMRKQVENALRPFYAKHTFWQIPEENLNNPLEHPVFYNEANNCIWQDGIWEPRKSVPSGTVITIYYDPKNN